jgi:hypothetical protein
LLLRVFRVSVARKSSWPSWLTVVFVVCVLTACGKKGPPLAPVIQIPAGIDMITAQRSGSDVYVTLTVPAKNVDSSIPAHISRIEVYGYTGRTAPPRTQWAALGDLVATVPVITPPDPKAPPAPPPDPGTGATVGTMITVHDVLTAQKLVQGRIDATPPPRQRGRTPITPVAPVPLPTVLHRYYIAFAFSEKGIPGPPSADADFPLFDAPQPPAAVHVAYTDTQVLLEWPPSSGIIGFLFNRQLPPEDPPLDARTLEPIALPPAPANAVQLPTGPVHYNVYREQEPDPLGPLDTVPLMPWMVTPPKPINAAPLDAMATTDPVELGRERCYTVRALQGMPPNTIEGDASAPMCFHPVDVFPPAAPQGLVAVADQGGISLIWQPNAEPDIGGYLVLRGEASDATLQPLTPSPVIDSSFRDTHVVSGKKYVYAVLAVDSHLPVANISSESPRVEETAR